MVANNYPYIVRCDPQFNLVKVINVEGRGGGGGVKGEKNKTWRGFITLIPSPLDRKPLNVK